MTRHLTLVAALVACVLISFRAKSAELAYSDIDRATVRVLALGQVGVEVVEHEEVKYPVAIPLAGHGSGVLISADGLILTAQHVVADSRSIAVMMSGYPKALPAVVVFQNAHNDVALIRVLGTYSQFAKLAERDARLTVRQTVFAIGYPLDAKRTDPQSTQGIVSGMLPDGLLQLGMSVNPGNSGGPVVDEEGLVRGVVIARSRLDQGAVGLAYAVPVDHIDGPVNLHLARPLPKEQSDYLRSDSARRSAALTQLMSQYGLEVLEASLSGGALDLDPALQSALDEASEGRHASVDGRLMRAAMSWNQALVKKAKGNRPWLDDQRKAVELAKQAAELEPALREDSKFIQLALDIDHARIKYSEALGTLLESQERKTTSLMLDTGKRSDKQGPRKTSGIYTGLHGGSTTLKPATGTATGTGFRANAGYWFEPTTWTRAELGVIAQVADGGHYEACGPDSECSTGSVSTSTYGLGGGVRFFGVLKVGGQLEYVDLSSSAGDESGVALEVQGGLHAPIEPVDIGVDGFYSVGALHSSGWYLGITFYF